MRPKPNKIVYTAWKAVNECCDVADGHNWETCLIHIAKDNLQQFNMNQRDVDVGEEITKFPKDKKKYDIEKLKIALKEIDKICDYCGGYHNESCMVSNARKAIEILIYGTFHVFDKFPFGEYLVKKGAIDKNKVREATQIQRELNLNITSIAAAMGFLTPEEVITILNAQKSNPKEFEEVAIKKRLLTKNQAELIKERQKRCSCYIGDILVEMGYIEEELKNFLLEEFLAMKKKK